MILKASQRGGAAQLAAHLLKTQENEHVEIHELSGFIANDLHGALNEIYAVSRGTKWDQLQIWWRMTRQKDMSQNERRNARTAELPSLTTFTKGGMVLRAAHRAMMTEGCHACS